MGLGLDLGGGLLLLLLLLLELLLLPQLRLLFQDLRRQGSLRPADGGGGGLCGFGRCGLLMRWGGGCRLELGLLLLHERKVVVGEERGCALLRGNAKLRV